jgi:hypothetical protein
MSGPMGAIYALDEIRSKKKEKKIYRSKILTCVA